MQSSNVIYRFNCEHCDAFYVGMTTRRLHQRAHEHAHSDQSAIMIHSISTGHDIDFKAPCILDRDNNRIRLAIKESLHIFETGALSSLNRNLGSYGLQLWDPHV